MTVEDGQWGGRALGRVLHWGDLGPMTRGQVASLGKSGMGELVSQLQRWQKLSS